MLLDFFCHKHLAFQNESTVYIYLNVKELLAQKRHNIRRLCNCNEARTHNHLVRKQTLNHFPKLTKWLSCVVSTYLYGAFDCMLLSCHVRISGWIYTLYLPGCQGTPCLKQAPYLSGCGFESLCSHLNFRYCACFEQGFSWHSGKYKVWIHSEMGTWYDKTIQSNALYRYVLTTHLNHLARLTKWLSVLLQTKWLWVRVALQSQSIIFIFFEQLLISIKI